MVTPLRMIEWTLTQTSSSITIGTDFVPSLDVHQYQLSAHMLEPSHYHQW